MLISDLNKSGDLSSAWFAPPYYKTSAANRKLGSVRRPSSCSPHHKDKHTTCGGVAEAHRCGTNQVLERILNVGITLHLLNRMSRDVETAGGGLDGAPRTTRFQPRAWARTHHNIGAVGRSERAACHAPSEPLGLDGALVRQGFELKGQPPGQEIHGIRESRRGIACGLVHLIQ